MYNIGEKIKKRRIELNLSQQQLADKLGYTSRSSITKIEKGENDIPRSKVIEIAKALETTPDYLMGWKDEPSNIITSFKTMTHTVPVYGRIPAGTPFEAIQERLEDIEVPNRFKKKKGLFGLKIVGDSMNRVIPDGAIAIFQQTCELNQGDIGAIMVNGDDATVKHFYKLRDACVLEPDSFNENHKPIVIDGKNGPEVRIIGKFIWYCMDPVDEPK